MTVENCDTCEFSRPIPGPDGDEDPLAVDVHCCRYPPSVQVVQSDAGEIGTANVWPTVAKSGWCGEHQMAHNVWHDQP